MANVATIQAYAGPGRKVETTIPEVQEITLRFKKKVIEIVNKAGEMGHFDLAQVATLSINTEDGENYTVDITAKEEEADGLNARADERSKPNFIDPSDTSNVPTGEPARDESDSDLTESDGITQGDGYSESSPTPIVKNGRIVG